VIEMASEPLVNAATEPVVEVAPPLAAGASLDRQPEPVAEDTPVEDTPVEIVAVAATAVATDAEAETPAEAADVEADVDALAVADAVAEQAEPAVTLDHAEPPALVAVAAVESEAAVAPAAVAAAAVHVSEPVAVMAGGGGSPRHTIVPNTAMSSMDTAPHSDSVGGGALPPVSPAPGMAPTPTEEAPGPVTRTVRIEVPTRAVKASTAERLLRLAGQQGASELFLLSQTRPSVRVDGDIRVLSEESPMRAADLEALVAEVTPEPWADAVRRGDPAEWLIEIAEVGRVRCASFRDHRGPGAIFRFTSSQAASADQLALDDAARLLATEPDGLVLVAGAAGSDKAAIVGAFVDTINRQRGDYVITLEPQVRVAHDNRHALISQREVGTDAARALAAARGALRENPDVLVIEDLHSGDLAGLALAAANDSRLVIVSIEAGSTAEAVQKVLELVAEGDRAQARGQMARAFRGAISQLLVRKVSGGRVAAREMLSGSHATARVLADAPLDGLAAALDASREAANVPLVASLVGYVKAGVVDVREAYRKAPDQPKVLAALKAAGVDTAPIEGLA
jgi:twitching motility protein PilT